MTRRPEYELCYATGRRFFSSFFVIFACPNEHMETWRLGMAVTKKSGNAVMRNRLKRLLREFFRQNRSCFSGAIDIVIVPKRTFNLQHVCLAAITEDLLPVMAEIEKKHSPAIEKTA